MARLIADITMYSDGGYLKSKSLRDCRLSPRHAPRIRVTRPAGVTGGYVEGAVADPQEFIRVKPSATPKRQGYKPTRREMIEYKREIAGRLAR